MVRVIRRLEELIRELATAAKTIGNEELASTLGNLWMIQSDPIGSNRIESDWMVSEDTTQTVPRFQVCFLDDFWIQRVV